VPENSTTTTVAASTTSVVDQGTSTTGAVAEPGETLGIYLLPVAGGDATWITNGSGPDWSPSGDQIAFEAPDGIYLVGTGGGDATWIANGSGPDWSPSGDQIAFEGQI
jgi:Tol biopolymer transport system component